jgi:O-antigen ligase
VYGAYVAVFFAVISGILPRESMLVVAVALSFWILLRPLEEGVLFFVQTIPLFIALPISATYDNLTLWRPLALVIFIKYILEPSTRSVLVAALRAILSRPWHWIKEHPIAWQLCALLVLGFLSLSNAQYPVIGLKRILYFVNLSMVPIVVWGLLRQGRVSSERIIRGLAIPTMIVILVGFLQLISTYLMDVYQFMQLWGEQIQLRQFGAQWSDIAVRVGNTWLAYYGDQLSLRMFSVFPDSHSFPTFLLFGIPALLAGATGPILRRVHEMPLVQLIRTYASFSIVWVPLAFLAAILSGTRGIWAASLGVLALIPCYLMVMKRAGIDTPSRRVFSYGASYLATFFCLFLVAWPLFISPQFLVGKSDANLFANRIRSVIDFGETSNALRIAIWKSSLTSITQHPWLGIGIGNFPVVLEQRIELARAGSTAHNLYLHVAAEMGIGAALISISLLIASLVAAFRWFTRIRGPQQIYAGSLLLYLPWIYAYVLTDPILFDERIFLIFGTTLALIWANDYGT